MGTTVLAAACWKKRKPKGPPPAPQKVTLRKDAPLRAAATNEAPLVNDLKKGAVLTIVKLRDRWCTVKTDAGEEGYVERSSFAYRMALYGTGRFPYTRAVADALRKVPEVDLVRQETTARLMPGSAAGGVDGADQLDGGVRSEILVGVTGAGRQFVYEVVDRTNKKVLLTGLTDDTMYLHQAVSEVATSVAYAIDQSAKPAASPSPGASGSPSPSPSPTSPHPNAPLDATPAPSPSPTTTAAHPNAPLATPTPKP